MSEAIGQLTPLERDRLAELEHVIADSLQTIGVALTEIREQRLYRDTHGTFEDYCIDRWTMTDRHARRLMQAAEVLELTGPMGPTNERQARELAPLLDEPGLLNEAWEEAVHVTDGKPTAAVVAEAVKKRRVTDEDRARALALRAQGKTQRQIAETLGYSQSSISNALRLSPGAERLPRRRQQATPQTQAVAKLQRTCREWEEFGDEEYIPAPELARRIRVIDQALTFMTRKRAHYYALTGRSEDG